MNDIQLEVLSKVSELYDKLAVERDINHVDELRLILIKKHIEDSFKLIDDFGKKIFEGVSQ